jgi:hypothetical protein
MCGSTDLVKQDGVFVCQSCGCKYSIEEAKKMMIEGTVEVTGTVKVDNSATIANYIELAESALKGANGQSVLEYTNKALEVDPQNSRAWILQMQAFEKIAQLQNPRTSEVITAGKNAVQFAKAEEKESIEKQVYSYYLKYARTLLMVATNELNDNQRVRDVYKRLSSASLSNALTAANDCMKADSNNITVYENIANEGVNLVLSIPNDALERCSDLWEDVETCAEQYQRETNALDERFRIYTNGLTDSAKATRTLIKDQMTIKVKKAKEAVSVKQANERKARIEKYWGEHKSEWNMLTAKKESLQSNLDGLTDTLEKIPIRHGVDELMGEIEKKKLAKKNTGIFNLKEKKKLQEQIDALESVLQKKQEECREESESISKKVDEVMLLLEDVENELSKDRE